MTDPTDEQCYYNAPVAQPGNAYGLVQGVTGLIDHERSPDCSKRLQSAWFGHGDTIVRHISEPNHNVTDRSRMANVCVQLLRLPGLSVGCRCGWELWTMRIRSGSWYNKPLADRSQTTRAVSGVEPG